MTGYDQKWQSVREQINVNIQDPKSSDPEDLLNKGIQLLKSKSYQPAIDKLRAAIEADPSLAIAYYYLALALLKGKRPKILQRNQIEEIDQLLCAAAEMGDSDGTVQLFRALIRDDYYNENRMKCPSPSVEEILSSISNSPVTIDRQRLQMLLSKLPMSNNQLYRKLEEL